MVVFNYKPLITILQTMAAWTPTFVLLLMFKRLYPQDQRLQFIKRQFTQQMNLQVLLLAIVLPLTIFICTLIFACFLFKSPVPELITTAPASLLYMLAFHLAGGALGEELGWRAFLLSEFQSKHNPIKSGFAVGVIWGFWHLPLWLVSGYGWPELGLYIVSFLVSIICCSILIAILYHKCRNLWIAVIVHVLNNYLLGLFTFDVIHSLAIFSVFYIIVTSIFVLLNRKSLRNNSLA